MYRFRNYKVRSKTVPPPESNSKESSDDEAPVALHFKDVEQERIKTEKAIKDSILAAKKKARTKLRSKNESKKSVHFAFPTDSVENTFTPPENEGSEGGMNEKDEFEGSGVEDEDVTLEDFVNDPKSKKRPFAISTGSNDEFTLSETFDFRKYLPESMFNENGLAGGYSSDSDSEELADAFLEGNYRGDSDDDLIENEESRNKKPKIEKKLKKTRTPPTGLGKSELKRRRRGGRRLHKKYSAAPRVIILSRQNTAALIRQRTGAFVKERLFGSSTMRGPRRMTKEEMDRCNLQLRARRMFI
ncbi:hypothetical protein Aperf_G00000112724 [Anoplocephala perfoliata]